ncbi:MAG: hypothetical protein J5740_05040 [Bacteroidales bacterium]|nr:hypothetical protein [Bacteroidales bacterium]
MNRYFLKAAILLALAGCKGNQEQEVLEPRWLAAARPEAYLYIIDESKPDSVTVSISDTLVRGTKLAAVPEKTKKVDKLSYVCIKKSKKEYVWARKDNLTEDSTAVVLEKKVYVRSASSVIKDTLTSTIGTLAEKGASLQVVGYDRLDPKTGRVNRYKIRYRDTRWAIGARPDSTVDAKTIKNLPWAEGWIYAKYTVYEAGESWLNYMAEKYDPIHSAVKNPYGGGRAIGADFYPHEKPIFRDRKGNDKMPKACYSLYLNFSPAVIGNIEAYIALAKETKINTFVIDIKDNECPGYKAEAMRLYSPTNYARASKKGEALYEKAVRRLHEEGFYVVGRITCFKDSYFVKDNPESAITDLSTGEPLFHNKSHWPSAYDRSVWRFNVELAKESVRKFGFDEINFDYVRFPDRMTKLEDHIDYHNRYGETKVQAIQRFVTYACDEIHAVGAYVSIDVFGECANPGYTTAYGQYWPALSNVADVMCGMPYPDHFPDGFYGISKPWNHPFEILSAWGRRVNARQSETTTPARVRTWVQAYHVMKYVDKNGIDYNAENIAKEIRGLCSVGLKGGYITWLSSSNIDRYRSQKEAFCIDYANEE